MRTTLLLLPLVLLPLVLTACSGDDHAAPPPTPTVPITSANAVLVARTAVGASLGLADVAGIGVVLITTAPLEPSVTIPGAEGGEVVLTWEDRDENARVSTGDLFLLDFTGFGEDGLVLAGEMSFDSLYVEGDLVNGLSWLLEARLHFHDLVVASAAGTTTLRGPLWFTREKRATVMTLDLEPGEGLAVDGGEVAAGTPFASNDYVLDFTFAQYGEGAVESESIGGLVEFATKVPFTGIQVLPDPSVGELEVRGASGSKLTIRAVDFFNVEILVDADGDGVAEETISLAWSAL